MQAFIPKELPLKNLDWMRFIELIWEANREIARFDWILKAIPNPSVLLTPLTTNEAVLSSKIEGTQATLQEIFEYEADIIGNERKVWDVQEVLNYRKAMRHAIDNLEKLPLSQRLFCDMHRILLDSVRWENKTPWMFRTWQVHIWKPWKGIEEATFIPPEPQNIVPAFSNLEKYIHSKEKDYLVQLAIIHAQFEIIHPFWDGNGRIGRIILPLFLYEKKVLSSPMFYISGYLENHRDEYYTLLKGISEKNDWESWITFFLKATIEQSRENIEKVKSILSLYDKKKEEIIKATHSQFALQALDTIFSSPVFSSTQFARLSKIGSTSCKAILKQLEDSKIIRKLITGKWRKPNVYVFDELINITG